MRRMFLVCLVALVALSAWAGGRTESAAATDERPVITWFTPLVGVEARIMDSLAELEAYRMASEKLGIDVEYIHASDGDAELNLLVASGDYPDLITSSWFGYAGGIERAYHDGVIIDLKPHVDAGKTPYFAGLMDSVPGLREGMLNDTGQILAFRRYEPGAADRPFRGFVIREDWLEAVGRQSPTSIDEWHDTLMAFRDAGLSSGAPFIGRQGEQNWLRFASAWGVTHHESFQLDPRNPESGRVVYGRATDAYRDFLATMLDWIDKGLVDPESLIIDEATLRRRWANSEAGAAYHAISFFAAPRDALLAANPDAEMIGVGIPMGPAGRPFRDRYFGRITVQGQQNTVSTTARNLDAVLTWADFWFSEEGSTLADWGVEGESFVEENGVKRYIVSQDEVHRWAKSDYGTARLMDVQASYANYNAHQLEVDRVWTEEPRADNSIFLPDVLSFTPEESRRRAQLLGDIETYTEETIFQFLFRERPLSDWDAYVAQLRRMGLDEVTAIYQASWERYQRR